MLKFLSSGNYLGTSRTIGNLMRMKVTSVDCTWLELGPLYTRSQGPF